MSVLIEVIVGAVLSILMSAEVKRDMVSDDVKLEQVSEVTVQINCNR